MNGSQPAREPGDAASIETRLRRAVEHARRQREIARTELHSAIKEVPPGLPRSDGALRIQRASKAQTQAHDAYRLALQRFYDYLLKGIVPEDLDSEV